MANEKIFLQNLLVGHEAREPFFKRNILKDYLQVVVLDFIYSHPIYSQLAFYGGSCLAQCFGLPRLSEDLDFVDINNKIDLVQLAKDVEKYFKDNTDLTVKITRQKFRLYLKFPVLRELGLAGRQESDWLFLKIEVFNQFNIAPDNYQLEIIPLFKFNRSMLLKTFDLSTLMATKIMAIFHRKWEKTDKQGRILVKVKGRDYFDLMWYLEKGIKPNLNCLESVKDLEELKTKLLKTIENIDEQSIRLDLEAFINDQNFVVNLSRNIKAILQGLIIKM
ncbi:nucleotidyl transferase AbiEii/AbiGii toxin family protein [Candidatus Saganbacteria bacterium]|nr:nucleotidyl transferase AbiEii/AbiGii toxin family protein [Candidatus Saganbacteria bacterium]